jgi:hypothetical protein
LRTACRGLLGVVVRVEVTGSCMVGSRRTRRTKAEIDVADSDSSL